MMAVHRFCRQHIILALVLSPAPIHADAVELINGDRLTGEIREFEGRDLALKTEFLGTLRIKWTDIESIETDTPYSILTDSGARYSGILVKRDDEISITKDGETVARMDSTAVVRIAPGSAAAGGSPLQGALSGAVDVGYSVTGGNQDQLHSSLGARALYLSARHRFSARLDSIFSRQDRAPTQSRHALNSRLDRFVNARLFGYGLAGFERNERRLLDLRSRMGAGVGWRLKRSARTSVALLGGMAFVHERYRRERNRAAAEGFVGFEWEMDLFKDAEFVTQLTIHPDVFERSDLRAEFDSELRLPVSRRLTFTLRLYDRFDTRPAEGIKRNDYGLVSGIGVTF